MKKTTIYLLAVLFLSTGMNSCKKGENDPFLSLKSRKSRMTGDWNVTKATMTESGTWTGVAYTSTTTIDNGILTSEFSAGGNTTSSTGTVSNFTYTVSKDGTYSSSLNYDDGSGVTTETTDGNWIFIGNNKNEELKNKEGVIFTTTSSASTSSGATSTDIYTGLNTGDIMLLDQLKSKEIIFKGEYSNTPAGGTVTTSTYEYILTAK